MTRGKISLGIGYATTVVAAAIQLLQGDDEDAMFVPNGIKDYVMTSHWIDDELEVLLGEVVGKVGDPNIDSTAMCVFWFAQAGNPQSLIYQPWLDEDDKLSAEAKTVLLDIESFFGFKREPEEKVA